MTDTLIDPENALAVAAVLGHEMGDLYYSYYGEAVRECKRCYTTLSIPPTAGGVVLGSTALSCECRPVRRKLFNHKLDTLSERDIPE